MINKYAILLRKNVILDSGIKTAKDENLLVNFDALFLDTSTKEDPSKVLLPSTSRVIEIVEELKDVAANTKWINTLDGITELPTSDVIQDAYVNDSLFVKDIVDGTIKLLSATTKDVEIDGVTYTTIQASINDGILYDLTENGKFETAIFTASGWKIDTSKNFIPAELNRLDGEIVDLKTRATNLEAKDATIEARLSDQGVFLTQANLKDVSGKGTIILSGTPTEPNKLPTRAEVGSMGATLQQNIDTLSSTVAAIDINGVSDKATEALAKAIDADTKAGSVSGTATTAAQDAHDAKIAAAKASDDLVIEVAARKAEDLVLDGKIATNATNISTNTQTINANKAILDTVKAQADLDHQDLATNIKPTLTSTTHIASEALSYGQDWNTTKGQVAMKSELDVKAVLDLKNRPITKVGANSYKIDFGAWNGNPALDLSGISTGVKAIINIHRTTQTDPVQNRYNDLIDQHYNDATSDGTCTIYLADSLTTLEKTQYTATVIVSATQATFSLTKADGTAANLNAAQEAVILAYQAVTITFEGTNTQTVSAGDDVARGQIASLTQTVQTLSGTVGGKQAALTTAQLAVVDGVPFTQALKTELTDIGTVNVRDISANTEHTFALKDFSGMVTSKTYVDAKIAAAGVPASVTTDLTQLKGVKVQKNASTPTYEQTITTSQYTTVAIENDYEITFHSYTGNENYTEAKPLLVYFKNDVKLPGIAAIMFKSSSLTWGTIRYTFASAQSQTLLAGKAYVFETGKNPVELDASGTTTLSALTSADLLVDKTYVDAIVAGKQNSTLTSTIAGSTTVVGALKSINANAAQAVGDVAGLKLTVNSKQNKTDNSLTTTDKTITGAINEINTWKTSATTELAKLSIDNTKLLELKTALGL